MPAKKHGEPQPAISRDGIMSKLRPLFVSAISFLVALAIGGAFITLVDRRHADEHRQMISEIGIAQARLLERQLDRSLSSTFALGSILRQAGRIKNFDSIAAEIIETYGGIDNLQLAPNGVVTRIYPLAGNEAAIGHELLNDPRRQTEALKAIASRQLTVAGPFPLIQGGQAVIGRLPVFVPDGAGGERFWGFTIAVVRMPNLVEASALNQLVEQGYDYKLSRIDPDSGEQLIRCPWLQELPSSADSSATRYGCEIYADRPEDCRHYPVSVAEMIRDGCEMIEVQDLDAPKQAQAALDKLMADSRPALA